MKTYSVMIDEYEVYVLNQIGANIPDGFADLDEVKASAEATALELGLLWLGNVVTWPAENNPTPTDDGGKMKRNDNVRLNKIFKFMRNRWGRLDLTGANLEGANLAGVDLTGATLNRANLRGANLYGVNALGARFRGADLRETAWNTAHLYGADFRNATLDGAVFRSANVAYASFDRDITGADFSGVGIYMLPESVGEAQHAYNRRNMAIIENSQGA